jgi:hypothetical protein
VAVNLYKVRQAKDIGGDLFRSVQRQKDQYQGIWIVSPEGKVLAGHHEIKNQATWTREVLDTLESGLKSFGPVAPRRAQGINPLPHRGIGAMPDGGVCLALYCRYMRGGGNGLIPASVNSGSRWMWEGDLKPDGPPVIDTLALSAAEWAAFAPSKVVAGTEWTIPEAIARNFARALSPSSDQSTMPRPEEALVSELKASIESVEGGEARIRLTGRMEMKHIYDGKASFGWASAEGVAIYNADRKSMTYMLLIFNGGYRMSPPYDKEDRPIGAAIEWKRVFGSLTGRVIGSLKEG